MVLPRSTAKFAALFCSLALPLAVACSVGSSDADVPEVAGGTEQPIITGSRDTGHPAVVLLQMTLAPDASGHPSYAACTGTIIHADPATKVGVVLTAGHCVRNATAVQVISGNDLSVSTGIESFAVVDFKAHPQYDGQTSSPYDVATVRILGVDANTPTLPVLAPDQMVAGQTRVTSVGFGQVIRPGVATDAGMNEAKNKIDGTVARLSTAQMAVQYDNGGDICHGDSGGPVIVNQGGKDYVAGVHSFVTGNCVGAGYSVRASSQIAWYNTIIDAAPPATTCDSCRKTSLSGEQTCAKKRSECLGDADCGGLARCLNKCASAAASAAPGTDAGTADCQKACVAQFPYGTGPYQNLVGYCSCNECESACAGDTACAAVPKCGVKFADATCNSCMESACCAEEAACGSDGHCAFCLKNPTADECTTNAKFQAVKSCKATSCATECPAAN